MEAGEAMGETVVGVGAGPVGLWLATQLKKRSPETNVILYERRPEYVRNNQISVHRTSLTEGAIRTGDALEKATLAALNAAHETPRDIRLFWQPLYRVIRAPAKAFENIFMAEALARGVEVIYQPVENLQQVLRAHPECRYVVATDGTHSPMRKNVLGPDDVALERKPIQASIDVQYMVHGQAQPVRTATYDKTEYMVAETIGKEENGQSRVGLRFLVDDEAFKRFPEANASAPLKWRDIPMEFQHHITLFQSIRCDVTREQKVLGRDHVWATKVQLSCYAAKQFAVTQKAGDGRDVAVFFAGNAAMGVPWYRSFNEGVKGASQLAEILARPGQQAHEKVAAYESLRAPIVTEAFNAAARKLKYVQLYRSKIRPKLQMARRAPYALPLLAVFGAVVVLGYIPFKIYSKINPNARLM